MTMVVLNNHIMTMVEDSRKRVSDLMPPPGFPQRSSKDKDKKDLDLISDFMTNEKEVTLFCDNILGFDKLYLQKLASILTSDSDYFTKIIGYKEGSLRVQRLMGVSDDLDGFYCSAILRSFLKIITHKYASYLVVRAMVVFSKQKRDTMYKTILLHALDIARDVHGCIALNEIINDEEEPYYRNKLLDLVAFNALSLSKDLYGNFVVQNVLKLCDLRATHNVMVSLCGHCVELSFKKYGSHIVEKLLDYSEDLVFEVVMELLECQGDRLLRLARSQFGNFVVAKALRVTQDRQILHLFWALVDKLMPFLRLLRTSRGTGIANILDSVSRS